jgi:hypothetical protein
MMYDPSLQWPLLRLLDRWGRLPLSDLGRMLGDFERPRLRIDLLNDMEWEGLVTLRWAGDECTVEITPRGRNRLAGQRPESPSAERGPLA